MRKTCGHPGNAEDPHPVCEPCQELGRGHLCSKGDTCVHCEQVTDKEWDATLQRRQRRLKRKEQRIAVRAVEIREQLARNPEAALKTEPGDGSSTIVSAHTMSRDAGNESTSSTKDKLLKQAEAQFDSFVSPGSKDGQARSSVKRSHSPSPIRASQRRRHQSRGPESDEGEREGERKTLTARRSRSTHRQRRRESEPDYYDRGERRYSGRRTPRPDRDYGRYEGRRSYYRGDWSPSPESNSRFRYSDRYARDDRRGQSVYRRRRESYSHERSLSHDRAYSRRRSDHEGQRKRGTTGPSRCSTPRDERPSKAKQSAQPGPEKSAAGPDRSTVAPDKSATADQGESTVVTDKSARVATKSAADPITTSSRAQSPEVIQESDADLYDHNDSLEITGVTPGSKTGVDVLRSPKEPKVRRTTVDPKQAVRKLNYERNNSGSEDEDESAVSDTEFPFKHVIKMIADNSEGTLADVKMPVKKRKLVMRSDDAKEEPAEFAALSTASGVVMSLVAWLEEFKEKDTARPQRPIKHGDLFKSKMLKPSLRTYKSGDEFVKLEAAQRATKAYPWLPKPSKRIGQWEADLLASEELIRGGLRVVSFQELVNQAMNVAIQEGRALMAERLHRTNKEANKELLRIFTCLFGTIIQQRRDDILVRATDLTVEQRVALRHADVITEAGLFPETLLEQTGRDYEQELANKAMKQHLSKPAAGSGQRSKGDSKQSKPTSGKSAYSSKDRSGRHQDQHRGRNR